MLFSTKTIPTKKTMSKRQTTRCHAKDHEGCAVEIIISMDFVVQWIEKRQRMAHRLSTQMCHLQRVCVPKHKHIKPAKIFAGEAFAVYMRVQFLGPVAMYGELQQKCIHHHLVIIHSQNSNLLWHPQKCSGKVPNNINCSMRMPANTHRAGISN